MTRPTRYRFRLFVAGAAPNSVQAAANLAALCRSLLAGHYSIEVVDVLREPKRALAEGIFLTPTLVKLAPGPGRRIVGTLSDVTTLVNTLGLGIWGA